MATTANLKAAFDELNNQWTPLAKSIADAGDEFDYEALDLEGSDASEKRATFKVLTDNRLSAFKEWQEQLAVDEQAKKDILKQPETDAVVLAKVGEANITQGIKAQLDGIGKMSSGSILRVSWKEWLDASIQKAAFSISGAETISRPTDRLAAAQFPAVVLLGEYMMTVPESGVLVVQDFATGGTAASVGRAQAADIAEVSNTSVSRSYNVEGIIAQQPMSKLIKSDNGRLAIMLETQLGKQVTDQLLSQVLQGTGSTNQLTGANVQVLKTSAIAANTKIVATLEQEIAEMQEYGTPSAIVQNISDWGKWRTGMRNLNFELRGMYGGIGWGEVLGVPIYLTSRLPANTMFILDLSTQAELATRDDVEIAMYAETLAQRDQDLYEARWTGAVLYHQAINGDSAPHRKYTTTNNFVADS